MPCIVFFSSSKTASHDPKSFSVDNQAHTILILSTDGSHRSKRFKKADDLLSSKKRSIGHVTVYVPNDPNQVTVKLYMIAPTHDCSKMRRIRDAINVIIGGEVDEEKIATGISLAEIVMQQARDQSDIPVDAPWAEA
jgi:hypothetical protein